MVSWWIAPWSVVAVASGVITWWCANTSHQIMAQAKRTVGPNPNEVDKVLLGATVLFTNSYRVIAVVAAVILAFSSYKTVYYLN